MRLVPNSWGTFREANICHVGRGNPKGGQFCSGEAYGDVHPAGDAYDVPEITHLVTAVDDGRWGGSHNGSASISGHAASMMSIPGYHANRDTEDRAIAEKLLAEIAKDPTGSEEVLYHSFDNERGQTFSVGQDLRLPLTATAGAFQGYGIKADKEDQKGQPVVYEFEKGTQMVAYSKPEQDDAVDLGFSTSHEVIKDQGHIWNEAIVAGGFRVVSVGDRYFGTQNDRAGRKLHHLTGKVVRLRQTETFHPKSGWTPKV